MQIEDAEDDVKKWHKSSEEPGAREAGNVMGK